jgi:hypothetical protein
MYLVLNAPLWRRSMTERLCVSHESGPASAGHETKIGRQQSVQAAYRGREGSESRLGVGITAQALHCPPPASRRLPSRHSLRRGEENVQGVERREGLGLGSLRTPLAQATPRIALLLGAKVGAGCFMSLPGAWPVRPLPASCANGFFQRCRCTTAAIQYRPAGEREAMNEKKSAANLPMRLPT